MKKQIGENFRRYHDDLCNFLLDGKCNCGLHNEIKKLIGNDDGVIEMIGGMRLFIQKIDGDKKHPLTEKYPNYYPSGKEWVVWFLDEFEKTLDKDKPKELT